MSRKLRPFVLQSGLSKTSLFSSNDGWVSFRCRNLHFVIRAFVRIDRIKAKVTFRVSQEASSYGLEKIIVSFVGCNKRYKRTVQRSLWATHGSWLFAFLGRGLSQIFAKQIVSVRVKTLSNINLVASRHIRRDKALLLVDLRPSQCS